MNQWNPRTFLGQLAEDTRGKFLTLGHPRRYAPDEVLARMGDRTTQVFVLLSGRVRVTAENEDGKVALLGIRIEGDLVGELSSLDNEPRSATISAAREPVDTRVIPQAEFRAFLDEHAEVALVITRSIGAKLRWATRRHIDFHQPVPVRLARVLYELAQHYGTRNGNGRRGTITLEPLTQPDLAAFVAAAEPSTQKAFAELRRHALIETGYRSVTIRDIDGLREFARLSTETGRGVGIADLRA